MAAPIIRRFSAHTSLSIVLSEECIRKCESQHCNIPPIMRYWKYCGLRHTGCQGEKPCDGLNLCCMKHDACVSSKDDAHLSKECSRKFIKCMNNFSEKKLPTFKGNKCDPDEVIEIISVAVEAALIAGKVFRKP